MKKIILFLLSLLLIFTGCSNNRTNTDVSEENDHYNDEEIVDTQPEDIRIWNIEPNYLFEDIDVPFTYLNNDYRSFSNDPCRYNGHKVYDYYDEGGLLITKNGEYGIINGEGKICVPAIYYGYETTGVLGEPIFLYDDRIWTAQNVTHDYRLVDTGEDGWGVGGAIVYPCGIDHNGKPIAFDLNRFYNPYNKAVELGYIKDGDYIVMKSSMWNLLDGEIEEMKKEIDDLNAGFLIINGDSYIKLNYEVDKYFINNFSDDVLVLCRWEYDSEKAESHAVDFNYINLKGTTIASGYSDGYGFYEGYAPVCKNNKWGYIDKEGNVAIDFIFDKATPISEGKAWVIYKGRTGRLNILDMLNNNIPFTDETFNIESYTLLPQIKIIADNTKIREEPSMNGKHINKVIKDQMFYYMDKKEADGYTWYQIAKDMWIADKNGEWIKEVN